MPQADIVQRLIAAHPPRQDALLPILHAIQDELGWVPPMATTAIAQALNLSRAEVHGVISFYHHFRTSPPGRQVIQLCRAEACQARGSEALEAHALSVLGVGYHQTTADGAVSLEPVYCLGNCASGPSLRAGDAVIGRMDAARFDRLLVRLREEV